MIIFVKWMWDSLCLYFQHLSFRGTGFQSSPYFAYQEHLWRHKMYPLDKFDKCNTFNIFNSIFYLRTFPDLEYHKVFYLSRSSQKLTVRSQYHLVRQARALCYKTFCDLNINGSNSSLFWNGLIAVLTKYCIMKKNGNCLYT